MVILRWFNILNNQKKGVLMQSYAKFLYLLPTLLLLVSAKTFSGCFDTALDESTRSTVKKLVRRHGPAIAGYLNRTNRSTLNPRFIGVFVNKEDTTQGLLDFCGKKVASLRLEENGKEQKGEVFIGRLANKSIFVNKFDLATGSFEQCPLMPRKGYGYKGYVNKTSAVSFSPRLIGIFVSQDSPQEGFIDFCGMSIGSVKLKSVEESVNPDEVIIGTFGGYTLVVSKDELNKASFECGLSHEGPGFDFPGKVKDIH